jgi:hypothetical protein
MDYKDYADQLNRHHLIKKAKETEYKAFLEYCSNELKRVEKLKLPKRIEGRSELLSMKSSYYKCLQIVGYIVGTGDIKPIVGEEIVNRNIANIIVDHYEKEGYLPAGTTDKFNS